MTRQPTYLHGQKIREKHKKTFFYDPWAHFVEVPKYDDADDDYQGVAGLGPVTMMMMMMVIIKVLQVWDRPPPSATAVSLVLSANTLIVSRHCGRS